MAGTDGGVSVRFAPTPSPRVSVVITGWKEAPHLPACLSSIARNRPRVPFEVIVSLNEPSDALLARLGRTTTGVEVLTATVNRGFGGACNAAVRVARGEFVMVLNDDADVEEGWLDGLVAAADDNPRSGAVGSRLRGPDGKLQEDGTVLWADGSVTLVDRYHQPHPPPAPGIRRVDYCSAASLLVRKSSWDAVGGFDEGYFPAYYEDVDLCLKLHAIGQEVLLQPASVVLHRHGASAPMRYRLFLRDRNRIRLTRRWAHVLADRPRPALEDPVAIARAVEAARQRVPGAGEGPRLDDAVVPPGPADAELYYLSQELAVMRSYASALESDLRAASEAADKRPLRRLGRAVRATGRKTQMAPVVRRWLAVQRARGGADGPGSTGL